MSRQLVELETILQHLIAEHAKLLKQLEAQQAAMREIDLRAMDSASKLQEATRIRIATLESRRRVLVHQLAGMHGIAAQPTLSALAQSHSRILRKSAPPAR